MTENKGFKKISQSTTPIKERVKQGADQPYADIEEKSKNTN